MFRPEGETIRVLVDMLPPHVFDDICYEFPDLLEMEAWKTEFIHWYPYENGWSRMEVYDYWELDPEDPELFVREYEDGVLVIE